MVVWRPSVARMVYLHTGTMGVHRACLLSFEGASRHPRGPDLAGKLLPCPTHPTYACAPTGGRKENSLLMSIRQNCLPWPIFQRKRSARRRAFLFGSVVAILLIPRKILP